MPVDAPDAATQLGAPDNKKKRVRTGCLNCKRKRRKCDETKPTCRSCEKRDEQCRWPDKFTIKHENMLTVDPGKFAKDVAQGTLLQTGLAAQQSNASPQQGSAMLGEQPLEPSQSPRGVRMSLKSILNPNAGEKRRHRQKTSFSLPAQSSTDTHTKRSTAAGPLDGADESRQQSSPESLVDDGIFLPGSQYRHLHQRLRTGILETANPQTLGTVGSPVRYVAPGLTSPASSTATVGYSYEAHEAFDEDSIISVEQECLLWQNWVVEVSCWLDKFDSHRHCRHTLPDIAKRNDCLKYAILAMSARQLERKDGSFPPPVSLALYQRAINCLLPQLHTKSVAVIASCVILCVLEMFSCSPRAWRRHLDGCTSLLQAMKIRGGSGGVEEALFWIVARMDLCGALISSESTIMPVSNWIVSSDAATENGELATRTAFEHQANLACYLCACVADLFARAGLYQESDEEANVTIKSKAFEDAWSALFQQLEAWYHSRSKEMIEVLCLPPSAGSRLAEPFDTILFSNGAAISGNQLYHTAALLMLQQKPRKADVSTPKSMLWHARRICAISLSNPHHGCWTNCVQPVWIAGQYMSHPVEHQAIIDLYKRIEVETGWGTEWRARDLRTYWGDLTG